MREFEIKLYEPRGTVAEEHPEIAAMWHPTANDCGPDEITCGSGRRIALICPRCGYGKNGEWRPVLSSVCRTRGGCPVCAGRIVVKGVNDVATVRPEIAEQWHPTLNTIKPDQITSGSGLHVYLVCKTCGYGQNGEWHPLLAFACGSGVNHTGCPQCAIPALGHKWDEGTVTTEPTCDQPGVKTFKCLNDGCTETQTEGIAALGHEWDDGVITTAATCTEDGVKTFTCKHDASHTYTEDIPAIGHDWDEGKVTKEPTYTENGEMTYTCKNDPTHTYTEVIPAKGYTYTDTVVAPTCTEQGYTLHECNEDASMSYKDSYTDALGHDYKEVTTPATCKDEGSVDNVCERCGDSQHISTLPVTEDHQWNDGKITKAPTCTEAGEKTFTCTICNKTKTEAVPATGHDYDEGVVTVEPTQTTSGIRTYTCKNCGDTYTETIPQLGHVWGRNEVTKQPTCEEDGVRTFYCTVDGCNETKTAPIPATGHDWDNGVVTKQATCTEDGSLTRTCKNDPTHTMTYTLYATGHTWDEGVVTKQPTHDENGIRTYTCTVCGATKTEEILATKYTFTVTVVEPTCTEQGYTYHKCNEDDSKSFTDNYTNALGHSGSLHTTPATCKEDGHTDYVCDRCGYSELIETLPKTNNHSWDNGVVTVEPTADHEGVKTYTCSVCGETKTESIPRIASQSLASVNPSDAEVETPVEAETPAVSEELPADTAESDVPAEDAEESGSEAVKQEDATLPKETEVEAIVVEEAAD